MKGERGQERTVDNNNQLTVLSLEVKVRVNTMPIGFKHYLLSPPFNDHEKSFLMIKGCERKHLH